MGLAVRNSGTISDMSSFPRLAPVLLLVLAPALSACGGDSDNTTDDAAPPPSSSPSDPATSAPTTDESSPATDTGTSATASSDAALPAACDVLSEQEVAGAFGVPFGPGEVGSGGTGEGDLAWASDNCDWEAKDLLEVQLALTGTDDFTGDFTCPEPPESVASTTEQVPDLGDTAYWEVEVSPPLEAKLRVCTARYNFDIELEFEDGTDFQGNPKQQSIALATIVLATLG